MADINGNEFLDTFTYFALRKLLMAEVFDLSQTNQAMAALSQRYALDATFSLPQNTSLADDLIAGHMAYCLAVTDDRRFKFITYPSEPFLSHAAATLLLGKPEDNEDPKHIVTALRTLHQKVLEGILDLGAVGEMWVRIVVSLAKDLLVDPVPHGSSQITYCQAVRLTSFLESLLGQDFWQKISDNAKTEFEALEAFVNFSHWVGRTEKIAPFHDDVT
jgi:hypothetical protein